MNAKPKKRRSTPEPTTQWLYQQALSYIQRYSGSESRVRMLLKKRVQRARFFHDLGEAEAQSRINSVVQTLQQEGYLNDTQFAVNWALTLQKNGKSRRWIAAKLREKGLRSNAVAAALEVLDSQTDNWEEEAARSYAERRRLGPYRTPEDTSWERRQKDLAAMTRAGFGFGLSKQILDKS